MNGGGCCTGAHALAPQGAAAAKATDDSSSNLVMSTYLGTATTKKRPPTPDETREPKKQRHHHHLLVAQLGMKRKYEDDDKAAECRENDKMFKCNYWEDPAYAKRLQRNGLERARTAAQYNQTERLLKFVDELGLDAPQQPPEPAGASDPPILSYYDRLRRFHDLDYW